MRRRLCMTSPRPERGASSVEYALLAALIAVFIIGSVTMLSGSVSGLFTNSCVSVALAHSESSSTC
jgi:Flp pilus assembly pilin Flp